MNNDLTWRRVIWLGEMPLLSYSGKSEDGWLNLSIAIFGLATTLALFRAISWWWLCLPLAAFIVANIIWTQHNAGALDASAEPK